MATEVATTKKRPRGNKRSAMDVEKDVQKVASMLADGKTRAEIVAHFERRVSKARIYAFIAEARKRWFDEHKEDMPTILESELARLRAAREFCKRKEAYAQMARYDDMIIRILGLTEPEKHLHLHAPQSQQQTVDTDFVKYLTDEELVVFERAAERIAGQRSGAPALLTSAAVVEADEK